MICERKIHYGGTDRKRRQSVAFFYEYEYRHKSRHEKQHLRYGRAEFKRYVVYIDKAHYSADSEHIGKNQLNRYDRYRIHVPAVSISDKNDCLLFSGAVLLLLLRFKSILRYDF